MVTGFGGPSKVAPSLGPLLLVLLVGVGRAEGPHDGEWLVELVTARGPCRPNYQHEVIVRDGVITGEVQGLVQPAV